MLKTSLRYFMAVVQQKSIRAAAEHLNIAQSAISRQLQSLEYQLGVDLLERKARGITLTPAGELLYEYGRDAAFQADRLSSELDALQGLRRGCVRIASIETMVPNLLPRTIQDFSARYPGITFSVRIMSTGAVVTSIVEGSFDIGIGFSVQPREGIRLLSSISVPLYAVMPASHPLSRETSISVADLRNWPFAVSYHASAARAAFDNACREARVSPSPTLETNSLELLHRFVLAGSGIVVLTRPTCLETLEGGLLVALPFTETALNSGSLDIIAVADRKLPVAADHFVRKLEQELKSEPKMPLL